MVNNLFYKILEDPRCIKYYNDLANHYKNLDKEKEELYIKIIKKLNENSNLLSNKE